MHRSCTILIVDDDENDIFFVKRAFTEINVHCTFQMLKNGQEVVDYLCGHGDYANRDRFPLPMMILMDLKMPIMDGWEFLSQLQQHPFCKDVRVIITSSSTLKEDKVRAQQFPQVWSFQEKPLNLSLIKEMVGEHFKY